MLYWIVENWLGFCWLLVSFALISRFNRCENSDFSSWPLFVPWCTPFGSPWSKLPWACAWNCCWLDESIWSKRFWCSNPSLLWMPPMCRPSSLEFYDRYPWEFWDRTSVYIRSASNRLIPCSRAFRISWILMCPSLVLLAIFLFLWIEYMAPPSESCLLLDWLTPWNWLWMLSWPVCWIFE